MKVEDQLLKSVFDKPIAYLPSLAKIAGVTGAVMLSQAIYWSKRLPEERVGWFYKSRDEWEEETGLSRWEQEGARKKLKSLGVLEEQLEGMPAKLWYRVGWEALQTCLLESLQHVGGKTSNKVEEKPPTVPEGKMPPENTTEITSFNNTPYVGEQGTLKRKEVSVPGTVPNPTSNSDFDEYLESRAKNKVKKALKSKFGGAIPPWIDQERAVQRESLTIKHDYQKAIARYPTVESVTPEVIAEIATDKKVRIKDVEMIFEERKEAIRGQGMGKWVDVAEMIRTYVGYALQNERIFPTVKEQIRQMFGETDEEPEKMKFGGNL